MTRTDVRLPGPPAPIEGSVGYGPAAIVAIGAAAAIGWGFMTLPWQAMTILTAASLAAFVGWMKTTYAYPVSSRRVVAAYLCAIAFQFIHMSEEYTQGFPHEFTTLFSTNHSWSERSFLLVFVFGFGAIWVLAAAGALYQIRIANYFLWFYALGAGLINAISHFVFPIIRGGYFPGLYTAAGHLVLSVIVIVLLVRESAELKAAAHPALRRPSRQQRPDRENTR